MSKYLTAVLISGLILLASPPPAPSADKAGFQSSANGSHVEANEGVPPLFLELTGTVVPRRTLPVTAEASGRVQRVSPRLREGYFLKEGDLVIEIDDGEQRLVVANLEAQMAQHRVERTKVRQERLNSRSSLSVEEQKLRLSDGDLEKRKRLLQSGALCRSEIDKRQVEHKAFEQAVLAQKSALDQLDSLEELVDAKSAVTQAELDLARLRLRKTKTLSPMNGIVVERAVAEGEYVRIGQPIATITDVSSLDVQVKVPVSYLIQTGHRATGEDGHNLLGLLFNSPNTNEPSRECGIVASICLPSGNPVDRWTGRLTRISPAYDPDGETVPATIEIDAHAFSGKSRPLIPGMVVKVKMGCDVPKHVAAR